jgi:hypothetical protein
MLQLRKEMRISMRPKVRVVLPIVQVLVAAALITSNFLRPDPMSNPSWRAPDWQFCAGLNAPATITRYWLEKITGLWQWGHARTDFVISTTLYFLLVWLLWYLVSIEIGGKGQSILTPKTRLRRVADVLAIVFGIAVGSSALPIRREFVGFTYPHLMAMPYFIWGVVISVFYSHDLWVGVRGVPSGRAARDHS